MYEEFVCLHNLEKEGRKCFYLMIKDSSDSERETCCCNLMGYFFQLAARDLLYTHPTDRIVHIKSFDIPVKHWLEWEIAHGSTVIQRSDDPLHYEQMIYHGAILTLLPLT